MTRLRASKVRRLKEATAGRSQISEPWRARMLTAFGGWCAYCLARKASALDHYVPLDAGGHTAPDNLVPACKRCNSEKGGREPMEFLCATGRDARGDDIARYLEAMAAEMHAEGIDVVLGGFTA